MPTGKRERVIAVRNYGSACKLIDCKRFFRISSGMLVRLHAPEI